MLRINTKLTITGRDFGDLMRKTLSYRGGSKRVGPYAMTVEIVSTSAQLWG